jgi:hypothetical protein
VNSALVVHLDLPQFDGSNPKLWQPHCEEQFRCCLTPANQLTSLSSDQFTVAAVTWLEAYLHQNAQSSWV